MRSYLFSFAQFSFLSISPSPLYWFFAFLLLCFCVYLLLCLSVFFCFSAFLLFFFLCFCAFLLAFLQNYNKNKNNKSKNSKTLRRATTTANQCQNYSEIVSAFLRGKVLWYPPHASSSCFYFVASCHFVIFFGVKTMSPNMSQCFKQNGRLKLHNGSY